jgi:tetratricopeptide (TPR) repeat protein
MMAVGGGSSAGVGRPIARVLALATFVIVVGWLVWAVLGASRRAGGGAVRVWQDTLTLPTYQEGMPDPNPPFDLFLTSRFNYPYTLRHDLTDKRAPHAWRALNLENEFLRCTVLPDLGGHLYGCIDKINGAQMFYANPSIKFADIGYRGAWSALGVEFNFPVSHNWMTTSPVDFATVRNADGSASIWIGNIDRPYGMQWRVELRLRPGRAVLEQHTVLYNRSDARHRFYWWTNAAVEAWDETRILYPMEFTASHGFGDVDTWPVNSAGVDLSVVGNHKYGPVSRFSHGSREPYMAVYHPSRKAGVVHVSSPLDLPAKKIWSWSSDADGLDWRRALSDNNSAYIEIQAGLFRNQETYGFLEPQEAVRFSESWIPIRDLGGVARANDNAVLNIIRSGGHAGSTTLEVRLNVTRVVPDATVTLTDGDSVIDTAHASLTPAETFTHPFTNLPDRVYTVTLRDDHGSVLLRHTENQYDFLSRDRIAAGRQAPPALPDAGHQTDADIVGIGTAQELDGKRLIALATYDEGLKRFPDSCDLNRAAGRLAVDLKQYDKGIACLTKVLARVSNDHEAQYYLGIAAMARGDEATAVRALEGAQAFGTYRAAALIALAGVACRNGDKTAGLRLLEQIEPAEPGGVRAGAMQVALLRAAGRQADAKTRLARWLQADPTSSFLRYEATRLGRADEALWTHLAGDPERILEIAVDYMRLGLYADAVDVLGRSYPATGVVAEVGMPSPQSYPLIAYYRGYCRKAMGLDGKADFRLASEMSTTYVFPNRADSLTVLGAAIAENPDDATAHFLLGSLLLSGGMTTGAMDEWQTTRRLNPQRPVLHRNMAYTVLQSGGPVERAIELFREGTKVDARNIGLYVGLDQALTQAGRPASERADALLSFPDQRALPAALVYKLATALAEAGRFDEAEQQFYGRFFPRKEGGVNVRGVYVSVRLGHAKALAERHQCGPARDIVSHVGDPVVDLAFTRDGLQPFIDSASSRQVRTRIATICGGQ